MKVIVVGSGLAGLTTAYTLYKNGHNVIVLEKNGKVGGNSLKASSGINFLGYNDSYKKFYDDTMKAGQYKNNIDMVNIMVNNNQIAKSFLESLGLRFNKRWLGGGHSTERTYSIIGHSKKNIGTILVQTLKEKLNDLNIPIFINSRVNNIDFTNNIVKGVYYNDKYIKCDAVVLATGGYGCSPALLGRYGEFPTTNDITTTGDGIYLVNQYNVSIKNLEDIQLHPTSFIDPLDPDSKHKFLLPEAFRGLGSVLVDKTGKRFVNELDTRDVISNAILNAVPIKKRGEVLLISNDNILKEYGSNSEFYKQKKLFIKYDNSNEIANKYKISHMELNNSLSSLNPPYYVAIVTPAVHYTMGGIVVDSFGRVLLNTGKYIKGLYACGEVTTGMHGKNRLIGNSLLECVVYGLIIGSNLN